MHDLPIDGSVAAIDREHGFVLAYGASNLRGNRTIVLSRANGAYELADVNSDDPTHRADANAAARALLGHGTWIAMIQATIVTTNNVQTFHFPNTDLVGTNLITVGALHLQKEGGPFDAPSWVMPVAISIMDQCPAATFRVERVAYDPATHLMWVAYARPDNDDCFLERRFATFVVDPDRAPYDLHAFEGLGERPEARE